MLTTGYGGFYVMGDTETYVVPSTYLSSNSSGLRACPQSWRQSMYALQFATGGVLKVGQQWQEKNNNVPIVCGGESVNEEINDKCYAGTKVVAVMRERRLAAASTTSSNGTILWITGGLSPVTTDTTEFIDVSMVLESLSGDASNKPLETLNEGIRLPHKMAYHCLEMISDKMALLYGGSDYVNGLPALNQVWSLDHLEAGPKLDQSHNLQWTPRAPMAEARYWHGCGVIKEDISYRSTNLGKFVVAAGGALGHGGLYTSSVELLKVDKDDNVADSWQEGPPLPHTLLAAGSATTADNTVLFLAGGVKSYYEPYVESKAIFSLRCKMDVCFWIEEEQTLTHARLHPIAMVVPPRNPVPGAFKGN